MPTYDYECESCGHTFERFQSITAPATRRCPVCKKLKVKRLIGMGGGVIFKGAGFYSTDYRSDRYQADAKADSPETKSSSDEGKSDTKSSDPPATPTSSNSKRSDSTSKKDDG